MKVARNFAIVALIAAAIVVLPGGGAALDALLTVLTIAFFAAIAFLGYRIYRDHGFTRDSLRSRERLILYGAIGLALLTFTATPRLFGVGALGVLGWIALLAATSAAAYWVLMRGRSYL